MRNKLLNKTETHFLKRGKYQRATNNLLAIAIPMLIVVGIVISLIVINGQRLDLAESNSKLGDAIDSIGKVNLDLDHAKDSIVKVNLDLGYAKDSIEAANMKIITGIDSINNLNLSLSVEKDTAERRQHRAEVAETRAGEERDKAQSRALTSQSVLLYERSGDVTSAFRYAQYAIQCDPNPAAKSAFYRAGIQSDHGYYRRMANETKFKAFQYLNSGPAKLGITSDNQIMFLDNGGRISRLITDYQWDVNEAMVSPSGTWAVVCTDDTLKSWNIIENKCSMMVGYDPNDWEERIRILGLLEEDKLFLTGHEQGNVRLWNPKGLLIHTWKIEDALVLGVEKISSTNKVILYGTNLFVAIADLIDFSLKIVNMPGNRNFMGILTAAYDRSNNAIFLGMDTGVIFRYELKSGHLDTLAAHSKAVTELRVDVRNKSIFSTGIDSLACAWSLKGKLISRFEKLPNKIQTLAVSENGELVALGLQYGQIRIYTRGGNLLLKLNGHRSTVKTLSFFREGSELLSVDEEGFALCWPLKVELESQSGKHLAGLGLPFARMKAQDIADLVLISPQIWIKKYFQFWKRKFVGGNSIWCLTMTRDRRKFAVALTSGEILVQDLELSLPSRFRASHDDPCSLEFSTDGKYLMVASSDIRCENLTISILSLINGEFRPLAGESAPIVAAFFVPGLHNIVTVGLDGKVMIRNMDGTLSRDLIVPPHGASLASISSNGSYLLIAGYDRCLIHHLELGKMDTLKNNATAVAWASDGGSIWISSTDRSIRRYDSKANIVNEFPKSEEPATIMAVSPDGSILATAINSYVRKDNAISIIDSSGYLLAEILTTTGIEKLLFDPVNKSNLIAILSDNTIHSWDLSIENRIRMLDNLEIADLTNEEKSVAGISTFTTQNK